MSEPTSHSTRCRRRQRSQLPRLSLHSQSVRSVSEANRPNSLRLVHSLPPQLKLGYTFGNLQIYQLQHAETESAPNVVRLLSAETECPPKVPIVLIHTSSLTPGTQAHSVQNCPLNVQEYVNKPANIPQKSS